MHEKWDRASLSSNASLLALVFAPRWLPDEGTDFAASPDLQPYFARINEPKVGMFPPEAFGPNEHPAHIQRHHRGTGEVEARAGARYWSCSGFCRPWPAL